MKVRVYTSETEAIKMGMDPNPKAQSVEIDLTQLTEAQRAELAKTGQNGIGERGSTISLDSGVANQESVANQLGKMAVERIQRDAKNQAEHEARVNELLRLSQEEFNEAYLYMDGTSDDPRLAEKLVIRRAAQAAKEDVDRVNTAKWKASQQKTKEAKEAKEAACAALGLAEKIAWIAEHGSSRLKKAEAAGYKNQRTYIEERVGLEFPDFKADFDNRACWDVKSNPSENALDIEAGLTAKGLDVVIVWLTHPTYKLEEEVEYRDNDWRDCEAIVIRGFLGKYDLVQELESNQD